MKQSEAMKVVSGKIAMAKQLLSEAKELAEDHDIPMDVTVDFDNEHSAYRVEDWNSSSAYC